MLFQVEFAACLDHQQIVRVYSAVTLADRWIGTDGHQRLLFDTISLFAFVFDAVLAMSNTV